MINKTLSNDADSAAADVDAVPAYSFDGFEIIFSEKVVLTPPVLPKQSVRAAEQGGQ